MILHVFHYGESMFLIMFMILFANCFGIDFGWASPSILASFWYPIGITFYVFLISCWWSFETDFLQMFFNIVPQSKGPCSPDVFWEVPWAPYGSLVPPVGSLLVVLGKLDGSILVSKILLFGIRICKTCVDRPQTPSSKELHITRATILVHTVQINMNRYKYT